MAYDASCLLATNAEPVSIHDVIRRHHNALISFLRRRLKVPDDAQDIAQEAYIRMMKYEGARDIESPSSMLFRIAANIAIDHGRSAQRRYASAHVDIDSVHLVGEQQPSAERTAAAQQSLDLLAAAIEDLPTKCREVFLLSRVHGLTYPEIASRCGISVKMVEKHISHALLLWLDRVGG